VVNTPPSSRRLRVRDIIPGLLMGLGLIGGLAVATLQPHDPKNVAVLFDPRLSHDDIVARVLASDGLIERSGYWPNLVVVHLENGNPAPLYTQGAWLVMNAVVAGGCAREQAPPSPFIHSRNGEV